MSFSPIITGPGLTGYRYLVQSREMQQDLLAKSPEVSRQTDGFVEKLQNIKTSDQLMADRDTLGVVLGAFGLQDEIGNTALIKRILDSDLTDSTSLANTWSDTRFLSMARAFNFAGEGGPQLSAIQDTDPAIETLKDYMTADDLLAGETFKDRNTLNDVLKQYGIEQYAANTTFLKRVLESDPDQVGSFTNSLADKGLIEFSRAFNNVEKAAELSKYDNTIYGFAEKFEDEAATIKTVDDLFDKPELLDEALRMFGLENSSTQTDLLRDVLNSDLTDENSVAHQQEDKRFVALAGAFEFVERQANEDAIANTAEGEDPPAVFVSNLEKMVTAINDLPAPLAEPSDYFSSFSVLLSAKGFFGLEFGDASLDPRYETQAAYESAQTHKILSSDLNDPFSLVNVKSDLRFKQFAAAFNFQPIEEETFTYPEGFAEQILQNYIDEEFAVRVGEIDPTQRFALTFEPGLNEIVGESSSSDSEWFSVIASNPLREVFQTIYGLPDSFGTLDIDQQVSDLKSRTEAMFGTTDVSGLIAGDHIDTIRTRYLSIASFGGQDTGSTNSVLLSLFA